MTSTQTATAVIEPPEIIELPEIPMSTLTTPGPASPSEPLPPLLPPQQSRVFTTELASTVSTWSRMLITCLVIMANLVQMIINFLTFAAGLSFSALLGRPAGPNTANWMAAAYSLTQGAVVLASGRLGAVYGHQRVLLVGMVVMVVFSIVNGLCTNYESFILARALTGVGGGLIMPNAVAMITTMLPPGRSRNITMGFFAASAPIGGWLGALFSGLFTQLTEWKYLFFFMAILTAVVCVSLFVLLPHEEPVDKGGKIDVPGAFLGLGSLILFSSVWNQAPSAGWTAPYEISLLIVSVVMFAAFLVWEHSFATEPIMPLGLFRAPTFTALVFVVLLSYMSFGISLWYMIAWQELVRGWTVLELTIGWIPFGLGASAAVLFAAWLIPRMAAQWIMAIGVTATLAANLLLATMPAQQSYWAQTFPAIVVSSICPDFVYVAAQIVASNSVGRRHQGVAGSLIGTLNLYGNSLGLGFAGTIESQVSRYAGADSLLGYRAALYFGFALAVAGLVLDFAWVRLPKDQREGWETEDTHVMLDAPTVVAASGVEP